MKRCFLAIAVTAALSTPLHAQAPSDAPAAAAPSTHTEVAASGGFKGFAHDVIGDYVHFLSRDTAKWLTAGGIETLAVHQADEWIRQETQDDNASLLSQTAGQTYGNLSLQLPLAVGWWVAGRSAGSTRAAETGRDLLRAQISALSWNYAVKYAVGRTRPNGDPRSFPSGHAAASFATAMVLQEHYGWKLGVPFFAIAAYTGASRIVDNKHWASDVTFAAFMGMASGRTVTMHVRRAPVAVSPLALRGGGGVMVTVGDRR